MNSKIFSVIVIIISTLFLISGCQNTPSRKIKLADTNPGQNQSTQTVSTTLQVSPADQHTIAILTFRNDTGDPALNWLRRGLVDMLVTELAQSPYLNLIPFSRLVEIAAQHNHSEKDLETLDVALNTARYARVEIVISGRIYPDGDSLCIDADLLDGNTGQLIRSEMVHGENIERIFSMVDKLSDRVRRNLKGDLQDVQSSGVKLARMTTSLEAFRCYSKAMDNMEKLFYNDAENCLEDAVKADTTFAAAYLQLAMMKNESGDPKEVEHLLEKTKKYIDKLSESDKVRLRLVEARRNGEYDKLVGILEEGVARFPSDIDLRQQLARHYRGAGKMDRALEEFETVLEMAPDRKMIYNDLGYVYAQRGDFTTAIQYIDKYRELAPDEPNPYDSKGEILMMAGELDKAIEQYRMALELWPNFTYSAVQLGALFREMGNYQKSIHYLHKASKIEGGMQWKLNIDFNKAATYWKFKKYDKAATIFQEITKERPNDWFFPLLAGEMYESIGKEDLAGKVYRDRFDYFIKEINNSDAPVKAVNQFKSYVIRLNFPSNEVLPVLEKYSSDKDIPGNIRLGINFALSLQYHRAGNDEKANKALQKHGEELVKILLDNRKIGWTGVLQYLFESRAFMNTEELTEMLFKAAKENNREDLTAIAHLLLAHTASNKGNNIKVEEEYQSAGFPIETKWRVAGPFSQQNTSEFMYAYPPEKSFDLSETYRNGNRTVKWTPADDKMMDGYVNLGGLYPQSYWSAAYAVVYVHSPGKRKAQIRLGSNDACKLWLNDKLIWKHYLLEDAILDRDMVTVVLRPGYNKVLLKVTNTLDTWGFYLRITDENGNGYSDINFFSPEEVKQPIALKD